MKTFSPEFPNKNMPTTKPSLRDLLINQRLALQVRFLPLDWARRNFERRCRKYLDRSPGLAEAISSGVQLALLNVKSEEEIDRLTKETLAHTISHYFEKFLSIGLPIWRLRRYLDRAIPADQRKDVFSLVRNTRPKLIIVGHQGATDLLGPLLALAGMPISIVARFASGFQKAVTRRINELKPYGSLEVISPGTLAMSKCLVALRQKRCLVLTCDEAADEFSPSADVFQTELFKKKVRFPVSGLKHLIHMAGAASSTMFLSLTRNPKGYCLSAEIASGTVDECLIAIFDWHRRMFELAPEQWYQWQHWSRIIAQ